MVTINCEVCGAKAEVIRTGPHSAATAYGDDYLETCVRLPKDGGGRCSGFDCPDMQAAIGRAMRTGSL